MQAKSAPFSSGAIALHACAWTSRRFRHVQTHCLACLSQPIHVGKDRWQLVHDRQELPPLVGRLQQCETAAAAREKLRLRVPRLTPHDPDAPKGCSLSSRVPPPCLSVLESWSRRCQAGLLTRHSAAGPSPPFTSSLMPATLAGSATTRTTTEPRIDQAGAASARGRRGWLAGCGAAV